jgi:hypothetical protein
MPAARDACTQDACRSLPAFLSPLTQMWERRGGRQGTGRHAVAGQQRGKARGQDRMRTADAATSASTSSACCSPAQPTLTGSAWPAVSADAVSADAVSADASPAPPACPACPASPASAVAWPRPGARGSRWAGASEACAESRSKQSAMSATAANLASSLRSSANTCLPLRQSRLHACCRRSRLHYRLLTLCPAAY